MSEKKNIDKLFKEQFKNFEAAPNDAVWERIERELHKDKRKRRIIIPIWWKLAGVAAILALLFTVGKLAVNAFDDDPIEQQVVDTETQNQELNEDFKKDNLKELTNPSDKNTSEDIDNTSIVNQESSSEKKDNQTLKYRLITTEKKDDNNTFVSTKENDSEKQLKAETINKNRSKTRDALANTNTSKSEHKGDDKNGVHTTSQATTVVDNTSKGLESKAETNANNLKKKQSEIDKLIKDAKQSKETQVTSSKTSEENKPITAIDSSTATDIVKEENAIENAIAEAQKDEEETKEEEEVIKRWSVAPNVAPVYFNTLGKGSSLDNQFIENSKEGDVSVSYGVKGSYALNNKLKIRAGINKVDLGYSTNNVLVFDDINPNSGARQMQNVQLNDSPNSTYLSASTLSFSNGPEILNARERGSIEQQLGFIEVPIELEYSIVDNTIGLNLIGGFSTLFLNNNEVFSVENNGNRTLLGEATNIKDMSYSANFGVGINYNVSKQLRFNLEPTFKYQINTFSNTSGDFQPFFIGVYTGLSFKF